MSIILLLDGYKTAGEGAHRRLIEYLDERYKEFNSREISLIDDLRVIRNRISYDGFFVESDYIKRRLDGIYSIIDKMRILIMKKLG